MAKFINSDAIGEKKGEITGLLPAGGFWEHWFKGQPSAYAADWHMDEHSVWEKALNFPLHSTEEAEED